VQIKQKRPRGGPAPMMTAGDEILHVSVSASLAASSYRWTPKAPKKEHVVLAVIPSVDTFGHEAVRVGGPVRSASRCSRAQRALRGGGMADSLHDGRGGVGTSRSQAQGHRVDEIHVHHRDRRSSGLWPWLFLLAALILALWGLFGRPQARPVVSACAASDVNFELGSSVVSPIDRGTLRSLASCLKANSARKVRLEGRAGPGERSGLARERADVLARELRALGVPAAQLSVGVGAARCNDASDACVRQNRSASATPLPSRAR
jgi:hypothetical protein